MKLIVHKAMIKYDGPNSEFGIMNSYGNEKKNDSFWAIVMIVPARYAYRNGMRAQSSTRRIFTAGACFRNWIMH